MKIQWDQTQREGRSKENFGSLSRPGLVDMWTTNKLFMLFYYKQGPTEYLERLSRISNVINNTTFNYKRTKCYWIKNDITIIYRFLFLIYCKMNMSLLIHTVMKI